MNLKLCHIFLILLISLTLNCAGRAERGPLPLAQNDKEKRIGGGCDGCELMYIGMPNALNTEDTSLAWNASNQKLILTGTVFHIDGRTPAKNVIIYYWHTNKDGYYSPTTNTPDGAKPHGGLRGWIKTDEDGKYRICTSRPGAYPNDIIPQHIHLSIKEPNIKNEYYVDLYFDDDKLYQTHKKKYGSQNRCGTELLRVVLKQDIQIAEHNIILGLNITNYPDTIHAEKESGLKIGEDNPSFTPYHAFGPDKGERTCPVCKYGRFHGIVYFVGNNADWNDIQKWLVFLEHESLVRGKYLKVYFVYGNEKNYTSASRRNELETLGLKLNLKNIALTYVPSFIDKESEVYLNKINPNVENTFVIFKHRVIIDKYIDLRASIHNFKLISSSLDKTEGDFFSLPELRND